MECFIKIDGLEQLEKEEKWALIKKLLMDIWEMDRSNIDIFNRLISELWYFLTISDGYEDNLYTEFSSNLIMCIEYGLLHFIDNCKFLWLTGYMISLFPYFFYELTDDNDLYLIWEQKGIEMLRRACLIEPDNLIAKIFYLGTNISPMIDLVQIRDKIEPKLCTLFPGSTLVEEYFKDILSLKQ